MSHATMDRFFTCIIRYIPTDVTSQGPKGGAEDTSKLIGNVVYDIICNNKGCTCTVSVTNSTCVLGYI